MLNIFKLFGKREKKKQTVKTLVNWAVIDDELGIYFKPEAVKQIEEGTSDDFLTHQYLQKQALLEAGIGREEGNAIIFTIEETIQLDDESRYLFELPEKWPGSIKFKSKGITYKTDFNFSLPLIELNNNLISYYKFEGPLLKISDEEEFLPDFLQWKAFQALEKWKKQQDHNEYNNLSAIYELAEAKKSGLDIDLSHFDTMNLDIVKPEKVSVSIAEEENGDLNLTPVFGTGQNIEEIENRLGQIQGKQDSGSLRVEKKIILLDSEKLNACREIIQNKKIPKDQRNDFFKTPSAWLDASLVSLDDGYSLRVLGVGKLEHGYFSERGDSPIDWFETASQVQDEDSDESGKKAIGSEVHSPEILTSLIGSEDELKDFKEEFNAAKNTEAEVITIKGKKIDIKNVERIEELLEQISNEDFKNNEEDDSKAGILIEKNDEELGFGEEKLPPPPDIQFKGNINFLKYNYKPFSYQEHGIKWGLGIACDENEIDNNINNRNGALLADDMGLGKTYMSLVFIQEYLAWLKQAKNIEGPVIITAPLILLENWKKELEAVYKESPFKNVIILQSDFDLKKYKQDGKGREKVIKSEEGNKNDIEHQVQYSLKVGKDYGLQRLDLPGNLIITTYQTLRDYQFSLAKIDWSIAVFDEAQNIKNPNALQTIAAKALKAKFKLLVTGTPIENSLSEFWCLFDCLEPGYLKEYQWFRKTYIDPISKASEPEKNQTKIEIGKELKEKVSSYLLRRTKEDELEGLPQKNIILYQQGDNSSFDSQIICPMTSEQIDLYEQILESSWELADEKNTNVLGLLNKLRLCCIHPDLAKGQFRELPSSAEETIDLFRDSGKLTKLLEILDKIKKREEKVIIFSISKELQKILAIGLQKIYSLKVDIVNGDTKNTSKKSPTRRKILENFQNKSGFNIIIMSPIAAGVGLTITAANNVIHLERHWNPAKEDQATDRVYRIGQKKDVNIYIPITTHPERDTFDIHLNHLINSKKHLQKSVIAPVEAVQTFEMANKTFEDNHPAKTKNKAPITIKDLATLSWELFEALIAEIFSRKSQESILTKKSADYGADVVVINSDNTNILIQCKHHRESRIKESDKAIYQLLSAQNHYERKYNKEFSKLIVYSSSKEFSPKATRTAQQNNVSLYGYNDLKKELENNQITIGNLLSRDAKREKKQEIHFI